VGDFADGTPYIGLDWFILICWVSVNFHIHRKIICATKRPARVPPQWQTDFQHFVVNHMVIGFMLLATNLLVHRFFGWAANDGIRGWVVALPFWSDCRCYYCWPTGTILVTPCLPRGTLAMAPARCTSQRQAHGLDGWFTPAYSGGADHP